uniref:CC chemokine SCYA101 n=1 Tax=Ictalurus punctatus TaxID=7998 RepID=Q20IL8_ICTPU|nr:CC chemokine SCYA101 [Ictalurus punctatus]
MLFSQKMRFLAVAAFFSCVAISLANQRESVCCKEVSSSKINVPITGFMVHQARPPCVKAVIFFTSEGAKCSHWRENWVKEKVTELRRLQAVEKNRKMITTTIVPQKTKSASTNL